MRGNLQPDTPILIQHQHRTKQQHQAIKGQDEAQDLA